MRITFLLIFLLAFTSLFGQKPNSIKLWVGDSNNYLYFFEGQNEVQVEAIQQNNSYTRLPSLGKRYLRSIGYKYTLTGDTLRFRDRSDSLINRDYQIKNITKDKMELIRLKDSWSILSPNKIDSELLTFISQKKTYTDTIKFQKIIFNSTTCYGSCPAMTFEIDNEKQMKFIGEKFALKQGFYTATLSKLVYGQLQQVLAISELDKFVEFGIVNYNIDSPLYTVELHYNNKVRILKFSFPPYILNELLAFLLTLPKKVELKETEQFKISFSQ